MTAHRPYSFAEAQQANDVRSANQKTAEQFLISTTKDYALAERAYREALAKRILELRAEGMAVTACGDVARGDKHVADLKFKRDVADGVREAAAQTAWRASADRKAEQAFIEWSMRRDLAEYHGRDHEQEPNDPTIFSGRRAE
jgi:hypothetical protein